MSRPLSAWRVRVEGHELAGRWEIAEQVLEPIFAVNDIEAKILATRQLHDAAGVRPSRVLLRRSYVRTSATAIEAPTGSRRQ